MQRRFIPLLAIVVVASLLLAACSSPTTKPEPKPPSGLAVSTEVAAWGDSVVLTGANFASEGMVDIGGVAVSISGWSGDRVTFTVPAGAPAGPQSLTLTNAAGASSIDLFVGVDFAAGSLEDLAALALPKGTAVRLGAGIFASSSSGLELDNLSLYGRGEGVTTVASGAGSYLLLLADLGFELTMADLTLESDATFIAPSELLLPAVVDTVGVNAVYQLSATRGGDLLSSLGSSFLAPQAVAATSFTVRDVSLERASSSVLGLVTVNILSSGPIPIVYGGDVRVENVTSHGTPVALMAVGAVDITGLTMSGQGALAAASIMADVVVTDSEVTSESGAAGLLASGVQIMGARGVTVTDSTFDVHDGVVLVQGTVSFGGVPIGGPSSVTGNSFKARDADILDGDDVGDVYIAFLGDSAAFSGNTVIAEHGFWLESTAAASALRDNTFTLGSAGFPDALFDVSMVDGVVALSRNNVTFLKTGGLALYAERGRFVVDDNAFNGHAGSGTAMRIVQQYGEALDVEASGNAFTGFGQALYLGSPSSPSDLFTAHINGNVFDFIIDAAPKAATVDGIAASEADLDATDNVWSTNMVAATVASYVTYIGGDLGTLQVDPIR